MHTTLKLRIPPRAPHLADGSVQGTYLLELFADMAAELLIGIDGDEGLLRALSDVEFPALAYLGDFIEAEAEVIHWGDGTRRIAFTAHKVASSLTPTIPRSSAAQQLPHAKPICSAKALYFVPEKRRRIHNAPDPLIITAAPVGNTTTREDTPYLPLTPDEIAADVARCVVEGATVVHLHVRDAAGQPTQNREIFADTIGKIRQRCDVIVQVSTEGDAAMDVMTRCQPLDAGGEMVTLATGTVNRGDHIFFNSKPLMEHVALLIKQANLVPCIEICDLGHVENVKLLAKKGLVSLPGHFEFVLGSKGGMGARTEVVRLLAEMIPRGSSWSAAGVGRHQLRMAELAVRRGGHARVGLEDNVNLSRDVQAQGSAPLVAKVAEYSKSIGRPIADVATARKLLGIQK
jgi:3-keto-5-aminohexanoate cleavage enzyme